jgi:hypothetical protein
VLAQEACPGGDCGIVPIPFNNTNPAWLSLVSNFFEDLFGGGSSQPQSHRLQSPRPFPGHGFYRGLPGGHSAIHAASETEVSRYRDTRSEALA